MIPLADCSIPIDSDIPKVVSFVANESIDNQHGFNGRHVIADIYGLEPQTLNNLGKLKTALTDAASLSRATVLAVSHFQFSPNGITLLLLAESHVALHTYPTEGRAFFDSFTCGTKCDPEVILTEFCKIFENPRSRKISLMRGDL